MDAKDTVYVAMEDSTRSLAYSLVSGVWWGEEGLTFVVDAVGDGLRVPN